MKQIIGLILVLIIGCSSLTGAQHFAATVQRYGPEDGLAHREVNAILQDRRDFMWFGTKLGLSRFDGATFTNYTRDKNGLDFDDIRSIAQDADGLLWLMGPTGQSNITLFDPITGVATSFEKRFHRSRPTHFFGVKQSLLSSKDGTIVFVDHRPAKLNSYHLKTGLRTVSLPQYKSLTLEAVTARNTVWVAADGTKLVELTMDGHVLRTYDHPQAIFSCWGQSNASAELFYRHAKGNSPSGPILKLYKIDGSGHRQVLSPALVESTKIKYSLAYAFNQHGLVWNGCQLRDSTGRVLVDITSQLPSGPIEDGSFFRDRHGSMWLGTSFGLYQTRVGRNYFQRLFYEPGEGKKPAVRGITAVGKTLYTNLENVGLFSSTFSGGSARQLLAGQGVFNSMSGPLGGKLYLAQISNLVAYDYQTTKTALMPTPGSEVMVWSIHPYSTKPHRLLAGGDPGLLLVDPIANRVFPFGGYNQFFELAKAHILHIGTDRQGTIWLCATTGLYTVDPQKGVTGRYWRGGRGGYRLPADSYQHFYQDPQGVFWLATANTGLVRWDRARNSYRQFRRADGLNNDNIYAVYADHRGHLWLSSDEGIMQFDPLRLTTRTYTVPDGITHNEFNRIAHYQDAQGRLYFGGLNGVTAFDPRDFEAEPPMPALPLRVVSFRQFDARRNTLVDKTAELLGTNQITLQPNDRSSILNFALLNYTDARKNTYAYQFKGIDDGWHYQPEPYLRLGNLPYGDYQLLIKGQAADGRMSAAPLSVEVHVLRPFYLRSWFLLLLIFLLLGGAWVWGRWRDWKYQKAQARLQTQIDEATRVITRQAQDLQRLDETKSRFFANISHEFRTPLTVILGMADNLSQLADPRLRQSAVLIERSGRNLLRLVNQLLDLSRLEAGQMPLKLVRGDLNRFIRYVGESFHSIARTKGIQLIIYVEEDVHEADFNPDKLQDIVANLLGNALKFTPAGGEVRCEVVMQPRWQSFATAGYYEALTPTRQLNDPWIQIIVSDTGPGIYPADLSRIFDRFYQARPGLAPPGLAGPRRAGSDVIDVASGGTGIGLSLVRELVSLMQGGLAVRNRPGLVRPDLEGLGLNPGAEFVVCLPLTRQAPMADDVLPVPIQFAPDPVWMNSAELGDPVSPDQVESGRGEALDHPLLLLVEDNDDVAIYIQTCLREEYQIIRAENGQIGIDQALTIVPDLILSDVMMPVKDGFDLCDTLKSDERTSHIPIVLLTARAAVDDRLTGLRRGGDAYLVKPFQREELLLVLGNLLRTRRLLQRYYSQQALGNPQAGPVSANGTDAMEDQFVTKLRSTLENHLDNAALDMTMICELMGMSRNALYRKVMALTGISVIPYLRALRLRKAEELLLNSSLSVAEVAYAVGFENPRYFSRVFSEEKGVPPSSFRDME
ncbi:hybrid sensor histidine kinase/response regulator transcription factor [Spirosoma pollinicola]|uniref:histidine kinase n=1 Tax=Spirosoma pollinicola TaxID=2057025 RepID=A0A2K8YUY1_9BACT|nr:two-component regulator propeller domain-containing protein [Spirosoma pollinicola]AUD01426.1 hybrid sensor histidine kinase/response regulator [Spirosoma pollinicola]